MTDKKKSQAIEELETAQMIYDVINASKERPYNTPNNYKKRLHNTVRFEKNDGISLSSPNLAFTNREIITRFASGIPITGFLVPSYETDGSTEATDIFSMETYRRMDHEEQAAFREKILVTKQDAEKKLKQAAQKQIDARRESERQEWLKNQIALLDKKKKDGESGAPEPVL